MDTRSDLGQVSRPPAPRQRSAGTEQTICHGPPHVRTLQSCRSLLDGVSLRERRCGFRGPWKGVRRQRPHLWCDERLSLCLPGQHRQVTGLLLGGGLWLMTPSLTGLGRFIR